MVHVWTDEVKLISQVYGGGQSSYAPTTSSPLVLNLGEGKIGHKIEVGSEIEMETLYKVALGSNLGGVIHSIPMKQVFNSLGTIKSQRFNLVVCVKKVFITNCRSHVRFRRIINRGGYLLLSIYHSSLARE